MNFKVLTSTKLLSIGQVWNRHGPYEYCMLWLFPKYTK